MDKLAFIQTYTTGKYADYNKDIVTFIANILYHTETNTDAIRNLFHNGYCYHFAKILQDVFHNGTICLAEPFGHIIYMDNNRLAYDIEGPYVPEEHECDRFTDIQFLGDLIYDFLHIPGKEYHAPERFHDWASFMHMSDTYAMTLIYKDMPKFYVDYGRTLESNVYEYWMGHTRELQEKYWHLRNKRKTVTNT